MVAWGRAGRGDGRGLGEGQGKGTLSLQEPPGPPSKENPLVSARGHQASMPEEVNF